MTMSLIPPVLALIGWTFVMWVGTTGSLAQPALYVVAHALKSVEGIAGGLIAERRHSRGASATRAATR